MQILVRKRNGEDIRLEVESTDTIHDVKERIQDENYLVLGRKQLGFDGKKLEDGKTLEDYHIGEEAIIALYFELHIFVQTQTGKRIALEVDDYDAIGDVMTRIQIQEGIPKFKQRLFFSGKELPTHLTLVDCCVQNNFTIHLVLRHFRGMYIFVKDLRGKTVVLEELESSDTIRSVKEKYQDKIGWSGFSPSCFFKFIYEHQQLSDHDDKTLADYNIQNEDTVYCVLRFATRTCDQCRQGRTLV